MAVSHTDRIRQTIADACARTQDVNQKHARDERMMALELISTRGFAVAWTPWSGRVRVLSMAAWDKLMTGCPLPIVDVELDPGIRPFARMQTR